MHDPQCSLFCNFGHLRRMHEAYWEEQSNLLQWWPCVSHASLYSCSVYSLSMLTLGWRTEAFLLGKLTLRANRPPCKKPADSELTMLSGSRREPRGTAKALRLCYTKEWLPKDRHVLNFGTWKSVMLHAVLHVGCYAAFPVFW